LLHLLQGAFEVQQLDLADLSSVKSFANRLQHEPRIDLLMLNAGVAGVPLTYTKDNFEMQVGTNHFGHFVLVESLLVKLKQQVRDNVLFP
jgi:NAD(P)-dependent dehydrogenase (short-subunit alcohol dehydrogenase family)